VSAHPLDNPAWESLQAAHKRFAETRGRAARYQSDVAGFHALPPEPTRAGWADLAVLVGEGVELALGGVVLEPPLGWTIVRDIEGVQYVDERLRAEPDPEAIRLGHEDVPEMLALVARTEPGPFLPRTVELGTYLGTYLGIRREGALVAMAGERLHPPGWTEISAVCTDPAYRGQGIATRLVRAVAAGIRERGETPFLHTAAGNTGARRLYERLGFRLRRETVFRLLRAPAS
jgi:ribosomal protein S18 acetylase RimI-like enzyme